MSRVNFDTLLEAGCHFGHLKRKWNPAMAPYIFMERNGIHIIDLNKTVAKIDEAAEDFLQIEKDFPNFTFHLALDRPDPAADAAGVKYTPGFVHNVIYETYLKNHEAPEDIEYYMCGPGPMSKAVEKMLDDLGVPAQNLMFDNFGG